MTPHATIQQSAPQSSHQSQEHQLAFLLHTVGVSPIDDTGWIRVTGADRVRWLNGMVTNSVQDLKPGEGNYSFALNAQGQIQGDINTFATGEESLLLQTAKDRVSAMTAMFDRFIIMDEVELEDISSTRVGCTVIGPVAAGLLEKAGLPTPRSTSANTLSVATLLWKHGVVDLVAAYSPLVPRFELWTDEATREHLMAELAHYAPSLQGGHVDSTTIEHLRVLEGTPRFGTDINNKNLAQETAQTRALHFAKGCYLGQEIVERIRSRGNVHRTFAAFRLHGPLPPVGTAIRSEGKPIAELTTVAAIGSLQLGLGLARREALDRGALLTYTVESIEGTALSMATPIPSSTVTFKSLPRITPD